MVRLNMTGSTHAKAGTPPTHSVKSKKQTPPNSQTPTDALPGSVSSAAGKEEGALATRLVLANLLSFIPRRLGGGRTVVGLNKCSWKAGRSGFPGQLSVEADQVL